jgi:hypothetical protein
MAWVPLTLSCKNDSGPSSVPELLVETTTRVISDLIGIKNTRQFCGLKEDHPPGSAVPIDLLVLVDRHQTKHLDRMIRMESVPLCSSV